MLALEELAVPLEGENPAGENLEYDPLYLEMDSLAVPVPGSEIGDSKIEGRGADWKKLRDNCLSLWGRTRDLRVAAYLTIAETAMGGFQELGTALKLIHFLIENMWETMYPNLDPSEDNDPTERLNILAMLSPEPGSFSDPIMFIATVRSLKLAKPLPYTLRDYLISINELETAGTESVDTNLISAELTHIPLPELEELVATVKDIRETLESICASANGKTPEGFTLSFMSLANEINRLYKFYANCLESAGGEAAGGEEGEVVTEEGAPESSASGKGQAVNIASYKPSSRADALLLLRKSSDYFQRHEPNSPIPLLVNRALRFSEMNFIELLEDIVPDALSHGKEIMGIKTSEAAS